MVRKRAHRSWCLFLDRDGVINSRIMNSYVRDWTEFEFEPGALRALAVLARWAPRIVIVTNQQGVGKGLMTAEDLADIHDRLRSVVAAAGGRIDAVRSCPHLSADECYCRKPLPGMATGYLKAHPELDGSLSVMVGDTASDMEMGRLLTVAAGGGARVRIADRMDPSADATYPSLAAFARAAERILAASADRDHSAP